MKQRSSCRFVGARAPLRARHLRFAWVLLLPRRRREPGDDEPQTEGPGPRRTHAALRELIEEVGGPAARREVAVNGAPHRAKQTDWSRWRYLGEWTTPAYAHIRFRTHFFIRVGYVRPADA